MLSSVPTPLRNLSTSLALLFSHLLGDFPGLSAGPGRAHRLPAGMHAELMPPRERVGEREERPRLGEQACGCANGCRLMHECAVAVAKEKGCEAIHLRACAPYLLLTML